MRAFTQLGLLTLLGVGACGDASTSPSGGQTDRPVVWTENAVTQPLPSWASPVRLVLPVPLAALVLGAGGGLGAYGAHEGGHPEGLDHVWIPVTPGTPIRSWADGTVTKVENMGGGEYFVTVDYGQGLIGKHLSVYHPVVSVGMKLKAGDVVDASGDDAEFMLTDDNRSDGERTGGATGSFVSPFDYLRDDVKASLIAKYETEVVAPYFSKGVGVGNHHPWEPRLTNRMLFHALTKGQIPGEWILINKGWKSSDPSYYDVLTILDVTNEFGHFQHFTAVDHTSFSGGKNITDGPWRPGSTSGSAEFTLSDGTKRYALYRVDESGTRATMTLEWSRTGYPTAITSNAAIYTERSAIYLGGDAQKLGLIP